MCVTFMSNGRANEWEWMLPFTHLFWYLCICSQKTIIQRDQACAINLWCALCQMVSSDFRTWAFCILFCGRGSKISGAVLWSFWVFTTHFAALQSGTQSPTDRKTSALTQLSTCWECARRQRIMGWSPMRPTFRPCPMDPSSQHSNRSTTPPWHLQLQGTCRKRWTWVCLHSTFFQLKKKSFAITQKGNHMCAFFSSLLLPKSLWGVEVLPC